MSTDTTSGMSNAEFEVLLQSRVPDIVRSQPRPVPDVDANWRDWQHAFRDATSLRHGIRVANPHPLAEGLNEFSFDRWARAAGRGLTTSDFSAALAGAYGTVAEAAYNAWDISAFAADASAPNYKNITLATISVESPDELQEDEQAPFASITGQAVSGSVKEFVLNLAVSRRLLVGDDKGVVDQMVLQAVARLNSIPAKLLGGIITSNPVMPDGSQLFVAGNSVSGAGHTVAALNSAISKLSHQTTGDGSVIGFAPYSLLAAYDVAGTYAVLLSALSPALPIRLQVNPWVPSSTVYLFANPAECASFSRLILRNGTSPRVESGTRPDARDENGEKVSYNGLAIAVSWTVGVAAVSRRSVVKIAS